MNKQDSTVGTKRAIIITVSLIVLIIIATTIAIFVTSGISEPVEENCGLVNDLDTSHNCQPVKD